MGRPAAAGQDDETLRDQLRSHVDGKEQHYVQTSLTAVRLGAFLSRSRGRGRPSSGPIRQTNDGKLGHGTVVRTSTTAFTYTGYPTLTSTKTNFSVTCKRS